MTGFDDAATCEISASQDATENWSDDEWNDSREGMSVESMQFLRTISTDRHCNTVLMQKSMEGRCGRTV